MGRALVVFGGVMAMAVSRNVTVEVAGGLSLLRSGKEAEAAAIFEAVLASAPNTTALASDPEAVSYYDALFHLGVAKAYLGEFEEAEQVLRGSIAFAPRIAAGSWHALTSVLTGQTRVTAEDVASMEALYEQIDLARDLGGPDESYAEQLILFAIGRSKERLGDYGGASDALIRANALARGDVSHDAGLISVAVPTWVAKVNDLDAMRSSLVATAFGERDPAARPRPIFIVGMPRSGSTLVESIVAAADGIVACGETAALLATSIDAVFEKTVGRGAEIYADTGAAMDRDVAARVAATYEAALHRSCPAARDARAFVDKTLSNVYFVPFALRAFPDAKIVHVSRDPRDVALSTFATRYDTTAYAYAYNLTEIVMQHAAVERIVSHWRLGAPPGAMHEVAYERLVASPQTEIRKLLAFLETPGDSERALRFFDDETHRRRTRVAHSAAASLVAKPIYGTSAGKWRHYEGTPLGDSLAAAVAASQAALWAQG